MNVLLKEFSLNELSWSPGCSFIPGLIIFMKLSFFIVFLTFLDLFSQKEDYNWLLGYRGINSGSDTNISLSLINFKDEQINLRKLPALIYFFQTNSVISNSSGDSILVASNGFQVYDADLKKSLPDFKINIGSLQWSETNGASIDQGILIIPTPGSDSEFRLFYLWQDYPKVDSFVQTNRFSEAIMSINENTKLVELRSKDNPILAAPFEYGKITACRHANGRDWWIVIPKRYSRDVFVFAIDPNATRLHRTQTFNTITHTGLGMAKFSPDGNYYAIANTEGDDTLRRGYVEVYEFDRCEGILKNKREVYTRDGFNMWGLSFSPNSNFIYYNTQAVLYRLDLRNPDLAASKQIIDTMKGFIDPFTCFFGGSLLAPDGRIYVIAGGSNRCINRINYPDEEDKSKIGFIQNEIRLPSYNFRSSPNLPEFRLGPADGSICDSLGINNIPLARFRYDQQMMDYLNFRFIDLSSYEPGQWHWNFGDPASIDNTSEERNPWHRFSTDGVYKVCLTVSNSNGSDTQCKTLNISTTGTGSFESISDYIEFFPNPVEDILIVQLKDYIPHSMDIQIYDAYGKFQFHQKLKLGLNSIDCISLHPGVYNYTIYERNKMIKQGRFVVAK